MNIKYSCVLIMLIATFGFCIDLTDINAKLIGSEDCCISYGDYDNDGDEDILLTGYSNMIGVSKVFRNDSGVYSDINAELTGFYLSKAEWNDYDGDRDLDILISGSDRCITDDLKLYKNYSGKFIDSSSYLSTFKPKETMIMMTASTNNK